LSKKNDGAGSEERTALGYLKLRIERLRDDFHETCMSKTNKQCRSDNQVWSAMIYL
jgi:hypothetical protein